MSDKRFKCTGINIVPSLYRRVLDKLHWPFTYYDSLLKQSYDAVVILHSAFSNSCYLRGALFDRVRRISAPKAYFIGNEYKHMPEKMEFAERLGVKLLVTMSANPQVHELYKKRLRCTVVSIPSGGLDTRIFYPSVDFFSRPIDIGFRADDEPIYFGHQERRQIADYFQMSAKDLGLRVEIDVGSGKRLEPNEYATFLNKCKAQIATEGGSDHLELSDNIRKYVMHHPGATLGELRRRYFNNNHGLISGRMMSGRHVEAAGTKTLQILFEGYYNGYFKPDVHYIPLKKDFSNIDEAIAKFRDQSYCHKIIENAYEMAIKELTYEKLIDKFYDALVPVL
jgi:hypothetical protein